MPSRTHPRSPDETPGGPPAGYRIASWLFARLLGFVYLIAFASLWTQVEGLIGSQGILPMRELLERAAEVLGAERYWRLPTAFWLARGDWALHAACGLGCLAAATAILGRWTLGALAACWALYLSLVTVGQDFLAFQWDVLLLEAGLLAVVATPAVRRARLPAARESPHLGRWLLWLLTLRLYVLSGFVKLASGDPTWRDLTALTHHYETQPLPTWIGWWAHQLPDAVHRATTLGMFVVELAVPWLLFCGARARRWAGWTLASFQVGILATGNYTFFNLLTIALCLLWVDDAGWPARLRSRLGAVAEAERGRAGSAWRRAATAIGIALAIVCVPVTLRAVGLSGALPRPATALVQWSRPLRSVNSYGLFAVMTTDRPEIVIEGSRDGVTWKRYELPWKPGDLDRRPRFVAPHQPRLDWQLWFAALGGYSRTAWFPSLTDRLLEGSPPVVGLFSNDPFPGEPPKHVRALLYDYTFTDPATLASEGHWWSRQLLGAYAPVRSR